MTVKLWWWYVVLGAVAVASIWGANALDVEDWFKQVIALPAVGALFAALFQILRDSNASRNERLLQERDHAFTVAATSHMSQTLFNKQVEFAEAYVDGVLDLLGKIFADGPTKKLDLEPLLAIRRKHRLWLTREVTEKLDAFEGDVREMRVLMARYEATTAPQALRDASWQKAHNLFEEVLGLSGSTSEKEAKSYIVAIEHLQGVLGIAQLTQRRDEVLRGERSQPPYSSRNGTSKRDGPSGGGSR